MEDIEAAPTLARRVQKLIQEEKWQSFDLLVEMVTSFNSFFRNLGRVVTVNPVSSFSDFFSLCALKIACPIAVRSMYDLK